MCSVILTTAVLILATFTLLIPSANAGERTLHTFIQSTDGVIWGGDVGAGSKANLVADSEGNLYGTTESGGKYFNGVVFELSRTGKGFWVEKVLHVFNPGAGDGAESLGGLIIDSAGNLYGTTATGGSTILGAGGTVFELMPGRNSNWQEKILFTFESKISGAPFAPFSGLVMDAAGNLYGTTSEGGTYGHGAVFELSPTAKGNWTPSYLYSFGANATDGIDSMSPYLTLDASGNLYGSTYDGGLYNFGTVFQLSPGSNGQWTETILYNFTGGADGKYPESTVTVDPNGNLFGTTEAASTGSGTVYEISPSSSGWSQQTIYTFGGILAGQSIYLTLALDPAGNLFGVSQLGGTGNWGEVWELSPTSSGTWTPTVLFSFDQTNGAQPRTGVIRDGLGNLYGVTLAGGQLSCGGANAGCGVAFEITP